MLITASVGSIVLAAAIAGAAAPATVSTLPVTINVETMAGMPAGLVARVLAEADAVWRPAGLTLVWRRDGGDGEPRAPGAAPGCHIASTLCVEIGGDRGHHSSHDNKVALGWIMFHAGDAPEPEIYLSYENALTYMVEAGPVIGRFDRMPAAQREWLLGRMMGRALAHEVGHYLLASKAHTAQGLMRATHTAQEFFSLDRSSFAVDAAQRQAVAARLRRDRPAARG
jgi:hypothetical protein